MRKLLALLISVMVVFGGGAAQAATWVRQDPIPPTTTGAIRGRVTEVDGVTPIASVFVSVYTAAYSPLGTAITDENGSYLLSGLPTGQYWLYASTWFNYVAEYYDNASMRTDARLVPVTDGATTLNIDFTLDKYAQITGKVTEADGITPISGAEIYTSTPSDDTLWWLGGYTDADGIYTISNLPGTYLIRAQAMNRVPEYYNNQVTQAGATPITVALNTTTLDINFSLDIGGGISGIVTAADGVTPLPNMTVEVLGASGVSLGYTQSRADGRYTLTGLITGSYRFRTHQFGYVAEYYDNQTTLAAAQLVPVTFGEVTPNINFAMNRYAVITGKVTESDGVTPISGVNLNAQTPSGGWLASGYTDTDGTYTMIGIPAGTVVVRAQKQNYDTGYFDGQTTLADATPLTVGLNTTTPNINITLTPRGMISGIVTRADGTTPLQNACVEVFTPSGTRITYSYTNAAGRYEILNIPQGAYAVRVHHPDYIDEYYENKPTLATADLVPIFPNLPAPVLNFAMDERAAIRGRVTEIDGTTPISGAVITLWRPNGNFVRSTSTDADGSYRLANLAPDTYLVQAGKTGYSDEYYDEQPTRLDATPITLGLDTIRTDINFTLILRGSITGIVTDADGVTPLSETAVFIRSTTGFGTNAITGADGLYRLDNLPSGTYTAHARKSGYLTEYYDQQATVTTATPFTVSDNVVTENIDFSLQLGGSITGIVTQADGITPIRSANVSALPIGSNTGIVGFSAADGTYAIVGLEAGTYIIRAIRSGYSTEYYDNQPTSTGAAEITVTLGDTVPNIDFALDVLGKISGKVTQADGTTPIGGARIDVFTPNNVYVTATLTAADGTYTVSNLTAGNYIVRTTATSYLTEYYDSQPTDTTATLVPVAFNTVIPNIDFTLEVAGKVSGKVTLVDGVTPIGNASVEVYTLSNDYVTNGITAADGTYTVVGLLEGTYIVRATALYATPEYYQEQSTRANATPIVVAFAATTENINFTLDVLGTISGKVTQADGVTPITNYQPSVAVYTANGLVATQFVHHATGVYRFNGLAAGTYTVRASAPTYASQYYDQQYIAAAATPITVTTNTIATGIDFRLTLGAQITGRITQEDGVTPIANVLVKALTTTGELVQSTTSNSAGFYKLGGLNSGTYILSGEHSDYIGEYYDDQPTQATATPVSVVAGTLTGDINFALARKGSITGRVTSAADATPIIGAVVEVLTSTGTVIHTAVTTSDGSYHVTSVATGSYFIRAQSHGYVSAYYDGQTTLVDATPISVVPNSTRADINFSLDVGGIISGRITGADGVTPLSGVTVNAQPNIGTVINSTLTNGDGRYEIASLPSGTYFVYASKPGYSSRFYLNQSSSFNATSVPVTLNTTTPNINFMLDQFAVITGRVTRADGVTPIGGVPIERMIGSTGIQMTVSNSDGTYEISAFRQNSHVVRANSPSYVTEYYNEQTSQAAGTPISFAYNSRTENVNFTLDIGGSIVGSVRQPDGSTPIGGAQVIVRAATGFELVKTTTTNYDGTYEVNGIPPGDYVVGVAATGYVTEYYENQPTRTTGQVITVTLETTPTINFVMSYGGGIAGKVTEADGVTPLSGANIRVVTESNGYAGETQTAADGTYLVRGLSAGRYAVIVTKTGYLGEAYDNRPGNLDWTLITVTLDTTIPDINVALERESSFSGVVTETNGVTPIDEAQITISNVLNATRYLVYTDEQGRYQAIVPAGTYRLMFEKATYVRTYYDHSDTAAGATLLTVVSGQARTNINAALVQGGTIRGTITDEEGTPIRADAVEVLTPSGDFVASVTRNFIPVGSYAISGIPAGSYVIRVSSLTHVPEYYDNQPTLETATPVVVTAGGITSDINFELDRLGSVSGKITQADGVTPVHNAFVIVLSTGGVNAGSVYTLADGTYTVPNVPAGTYIVLAGAQGYTSEYYDNQAVRALATIITVNINLTTPNINFALSPAIPMARLTGTITLSYLPPKPHPQWILPVTVTVTPTAGGTAVYSDTVMTDQNGVFTIPTLPVGTYTIVIRGGNTLPNTLPNVALMAGDNTLAIGTLRGGNANGDGIININDFGILALAFNKMAGDDGFDPRADFNNDGLVNLTDFSIMANNFGQSTE